MLQWLPPEGSGSVAAIVDLQSTPLCMAMLGNTEKGGSCDKTRRMGDGDGGTGAKGKGGTLGEHALSLPDPLLAPFSLSPSLSPTGGTIGEHALSPSYLIKK